MHVDALTGKPCQKRSDRILIIGVCEDGNQLRPPHILCDGDAIGPCDSCGEGHRQ
jgi:hypothetical protein